MSAGCNCGPNSPLARALGCHCVRRCTAVIASQLPLRGCKAPLFKIVSGAISSELALPFALPYTAAVDLSNFNIGPLLPRHL